MIAFGPLEIKGAAVVIRRVEDAETEISRSLLLERQAQCDADCWLILHALCLLVLGLPLRRHARSVPFAYSKNIFAGYRVRGSRLGLSRDTFRIEATLTWR
jgi:hypothetical protein